MKNLKQLARNQFKRKYKFLSDPIKSKFRSRGVNIATKYAWFYKHLKVNNTSILYESRDGQSMTDSPYAVFEYLFTSASHKNFTHIWVADSKEKIREFKKKYINKKQVRFVVKGSEQYLKALAESKYLINNSTFPNYFSKKPDQVYVNTWHGTPIKAMGLDMEDNLLASQNVIKNFLSSDILVSPNAYTTEIFQRAYKLKGLYEGEIAEIGYPRIDLTIHANKDEILKELKRTGLKINNNKLLVFAPTWRGEDNKNPEDSLDDLYKIIEQLNNNTDYATLIKVHPFVYKKAENMHMLRKYLIPDTFDTNKLLGVTDLLITDYSSIFFDYLITGNPIIFYTPDFDSYKNSRGLYIDTKLLPGPTLFNVDQLIEAVQNSQKLLRQYKENYKHFQSLYVCNDDGNVTQKLVQRMFNHNNFKSKHKKTKILMYPGGMINNGITSSAINLLDNIDYDQYDVTIFLGYTRNLEVLNNIKTVNPNVRIIFRYGPLLATTIEKYQDTFIKNRGIQSKIEKELYPTELYEREFRKIFGISEFDVVIDFSGYSMFWSKILLGTNSKKKLIYLHSDMASDMNRTINGVKPHHQNLKGVMSMYDRYDYLVSVSNETEKVNKSKISNANTIEKFTSAMNTINIDKINEFSKDDSEVFIRHEETVLAYVENNMIKNVPFNQNDFKVMAMGRLSPEKGFDILIKSFKTIVELNVHAKLYILGEGPIRYSLENLIHQLNLQNNVFLIGQKRNPFSIMKQCNLFALTSHYEGQSMVLLEALTLGMNVIASNIPANRYVLQEGKYGMLTENTPEQVAASIVRFMDNKIPEFEKFDSEAYNKIAISQFYKLIK
ncbi:glycosyltransferase [Staphylococcus simulans]|uniref:glycosyltransferase n=3 Tax=Staphylococcus simulans TaxID=1286 RepID=UPI000D045935|nr:glycosyltransferase [Staphylococcus simulans]PTJ17930.1 teichoic acid biosynthesis protein [Staphylococcus simulans]